MYVRPPGLAGRANWRLRADIRELDEEAYRAGKGGTHALSDKRNGVERGIVCGHQKPEES